MTDFFKLLEKLAPWKSNSGFDYDSTSEDPSESNEKLPRQLKDPDKEVMVVKNDKVEVIDKKDLADYKAKGYKLAESYAGENFKAAPGSMHGSYNDYGPLVTVYRNGALEGMMHLETACNIWKRALPANTRISFFGNKTGIPSYDTALNDLLRIGTHRFERIFGKGGNDTLAKSTIVFKWSKWNKDVVDCPKVGHNIKD